jgi:hypothetical protein
MAMIVLFGCRAWAHIMAGFVPRLPKIIWHIHQLQGVDVLALSPPAP